eukprot:1085180-Prorocentrum_minimum.AAC.1
MLRLRVTMPLTHLWAERDVLRADPRVAVELLEDVRAAYHHQRSSPSPARAYMYDKAVTAV